MFASLCVAWPNVSLAKLKTETVTSGAVKATLTYNVGPGLFNVSGTHLQIVRAGATMLDTDVPEPCNGCGIVPAGAGGGTAKSLQAADLDGDGDMDIVACSLVQRGRLPAERRARPDLPSLVWLEQTAPGTFAPHTLETGGAHLSLDLGDWDGDGDTDIVVANSLSGRPGFVEVWENRGTPPAVPAR